MLEFFWPRGGWGRAARYVQYRLHRLPDSPETIARAAEGLGCRSVAFTYNDPVIFHEYAIDVARACRERGVFSVAGTACDRSR